MNMKEAYHRIAERIDEGIDRIQDALDYAGCDGPQFADRKAIGRIGTTGYLIGLVAGLHIGIFLSIIILKMLSPITNSFLTALIWWCCYMILLSSFHFLEFFITAISQPSTLNNDSYIVHHSKSYTLAALASWIEYWLEYLFLGQLKFFFYISITGIVLVVLGQCIRSIAMLHCGENFSHQIMDRKRNDHQLVTTGIYSILRHPSYFGWFYWSIGTQLILCNPICIILYTIAAYLFFRDRIDYEERLLFKFYQQQYVDYCRHSFIGIPGVISPINTAIATATINKKQ